MGFFNNIDSGIIHVADWFDVDNEFYPVGTILHLPEKRPYSETYCMCVEDNRPAPRDLGPDAKSGYKGDCSECAFSGTTICLKCISCERKDNTTVYFKRLNK